jgi:predicted RNA-binding protein
VIKFLQGEGHSLHNLATSMYQEDVTNRLEQVVSVLEGLKLVQKKTFRIQNIQHVTYAYVGPNIAAMVKENEFSLYKKQADLKETIIPMEKLNVGSFLFLPYLQQRNALENRLK